jgi:hypothetical protein
MARPALRAVEPGIQTVTVTPINMVEIRLKVAGTAPLVMNAFSEKSRQQMATQMSTEQAKRKSKKDRPPRDYDKEWHDAHHYAKGDDPWIGLPANGFRSCCIEGCRLANVMMTRAKQALFLVPDGWDAVDGQGLVKLIADGPAEKTLMHVRNDNGVVDLRSRPMWRKWEAIVTLRFDADWISAENVLNLVNRGGTQVGICEGRPGSPNSHGMGWGTFEIVGALNPETIKGPDVRAMLDAMSEDTPPQPIHEVKP